jgi:hypothetical protein
MSETINGLLGTNYSQEVSWAIIAGAIVVLLLLLWLFIRLARGPRLNARQGKQARLGITSVLRVDDRRQLVLFRRDEVEHLIMIGGSNELVVESNIRPASARRPDPLAGAPAEVKQRVAAARPQPRPTPSPSVRETPKLEVKTDPKPALGDKKDRSEDAVARREPMMPRVSDTPNNPVQDDDSMLGDVRPKR